jgi:hypothetical protein
MRAVGQACLSLQINFVWSGPSRLEREAILPIPEEIAGHMHDVSTAGKLVEWIELARSGVIAVGMMLLSVLCT